MIPLDTLDSILLRSALSRIFDTRGFRYMSYALSGAAMTVAALATYENLTGAEVVPEMTGPVLAGVIIVASFGYSYAARRKAGRADPMTQKDNTTDPHNHHQ
ncbi:MAG TPA: hypothetical protein VFT58_00315 [Nitrososphaera sp.]|nr:hypothetical protein [Nitrososphaera sp.]